MVDIRAQSSRFVAWRGAFSLRYLACLLSISPFPDLSLPPPAWRSSPGQNHGHRPPPSTSISIRNPNDAASGPSTGIARLQTVLMPAFAQVVRARVHDDGAAQHGVLADQLDEAVLDAALAVAVGVGLEVAEVADVAGFVAGGTAWGGDVSRGLYGIGLSRFGRCGRIAGFVGVQQQQQQQRNPRSYSPMGLAKGVEMRPGRSTAVGIVAELVDVHAALGRGVAAGDVVGDGCGGGLGGLLEGDCSADLGVAAEDCDCVGVSGGWVRCLSGTSKGRREDVPGGLGQESCDAGAFVRAAPWFVCHCICQTVELLCLLVTLNCSHGCGASMQ